MRRVTRSPLFTVMVEGENCHCCAVMENSLEAGVVGAGSEVGVSEIGVGVGAGTGISVEAEGVFSGSGVADRFVAGDVF